ncbi:MAG: archease [archaeon]
MRRFEYLEHTADAKFRAFGHSKEEAFANAARAMFNIMVETAEVEPKMTKTVKVSAESETALLYDFLESLLFLVDTQCFILADVKRLTIDGNSIEAEVIGDIANNQYDIKTTIKAMTYNEMEIVEKDGVWTLQVVVDI